MNANYNMASAPLIDSADDLKARTVYTDTPLNKQQLGDVNNYLGTNLYSQEFTNSYIKETCGHPKMRFIRYYVNQRITENLISNYEIIVDLCGDINRDQQYFDEVGYPNVVYIYTRPSKTGKDIKKQESFDRRQHVYCKHDLMELNEPGCTCDFDSYDLQSYAGQKIKVCILMFDCIYYYTPETIRQALLKYNTRTYDTTIICASIKMLEPSGSYFDEYKWERSGSMVSVLLKNNIEGYSHKDADWVMNSNWAHSRGVIKYASWFRQCSIISNQLFYDKIYNVSEIKLVDRLTIENMFEYDQRYNMKYQNKYSWPCSFSYYAYCDDTDVHVFSKDAFAWFWFTGWRYNIIPLKFVLEVENKLRDCSTNAISMSRAIAAANEVYRNWYESNRQVESSWKHYAPELARTMNLEERASLYNNSMYASKRYTALLSSVLLDYNKSIDAMNWKQLMYTILLLIIIYPVIVILKLLMTYGSYTIAVVLHNVNRLFWWIEWEIEKVPLKDVGKLNIITKFTTRKLLVDGGEVPSGDGAKNIEGVIILLVITLSFILIIVMCYMRRKQYQNFGFKFKPTPLYGVCYGCNKGPTCPLKYNAVLEIATDDCCLEQKIVGTTVYPCLNLYLRSFLVPQNCQHNLLLSLEHRNCKAFQTPRDRDWAIFRAYLLEYWKYHYVQGREHTQSEVYKSIRKTSAKLSYKRGVKQNMATNRDVFKPHVNMYGGMFVKSEFLNTNKLETMDGVSIEKNGSTTCKMARIIVATGSSTNDTIMGVVKTMLQAFKNIASGISGQIDDTHSVVMGDPHLMFTAGMSRDKVGDVFYECQKKFNHALAGDHNALDSHVVPCMLATMSEMYGMSLDRTDMYSDRKIIQSCMDKQTVLKAAKVGGKDIVVGQSDHEISLSQEGVRGSGQPNTSSDNTILCMVLIRFIMNIMSLIPADVDKSWLQNNLMDIMQLPFDKIYSKKTHNALVTDWMCLGNGDNSVIMFNSTNPETVLILLTQLKKMFGFDWKSELKNMKTDCIEYCSAIFVPVIVRNTATRVEKHSYCLQPNLGRVLSKWGQTTKRVSDAQVNRYIYEVSYVYKKDFSHIDFVYNYFNKIMSKHNYVLHNKKLRHKYNMAGKDKANPSIDYDNLTYFDIDPEYSFTRDQNIEYECTTETRVILEKHYGFDIINDQHLKDFFNSFVDHEFDYCVNQYKQAYGKIVKILEKDCLGVTDSLLTEAKIPKSEPINIPRSYTLEPESSNIGIFEIGGVNYINCHPLVADVTDIVVPYMNGKPYGGVAVELMKSVKDAERDWVRSKKPAVFTTFSYGFNKLIHIISLQPNDDYNYRLTHFLTNLDDNKVSHRSFGIVPFKLDYEIVTTINSYSLLATKVKKPIWIAFEDTATWKCLEEHVLLERIDHKQRMIHKYVLNDQLTVQTMKNIKSMYPNVVSQRINNNKLISNVSFETQDIKTYTKNCPAKTYCFDHVFDSLSELAMHQFIIIIDCKYEPGSDMYYDYYKRYGLQMASEKRGENWLLVEKFYSRFLAISCGEQFVYFYYNRKHYFRSYDDDDNIVREIRGVVKELINGLETYEPVEIGQVVDNYEKYVDKYNEHALLNNNLDDIENILD